MTNPFRSWKYLPWQRLSIIAGLTTAIAIAADLLLLLSVTYIPGMAASLGLLFAPGLGILVSIGLATLVGALAVLLLERIYPRVTITVGVLWALVGCLMVSMLMADLLVPLKVLFVSLNQLSLVGWVLGVFVLAGKRYWR